jgi:hypothetical protein
MVLERDILILERHILVDNNEVRSCINLSMIHPSRHRFSAVAFADEFSGRYPWRLAE